MRKLLLMLMVLLPAARMSAQDDPQSYGTRGCRGDGKLCGRLQWQCAEEYATDVLRLVEIQLRSIQGLAPQCYVWQAERFLEGCRYLLSRLCDGGVFLQSQSLGCEPRV